MPISENIDRRKIKKLLTLGPVDEGLTENVGTRQFFNYTEPRCRVCKLPFHLRVEVERMLVQGYSYAEIARRCASTLMIPHINGDSVGAHDKKHMDYQNTAIREFVKRRAEEAGINHVEGTQRIVTGLALTDLVINTAFDKLLDGSLNPSVRDALEAVELQETIKDDELRNVSQYQAYEQLAVILEAVREFIPEERRPELKAFLEDRGIMSSLTKTDHAVDVDFVDYEEEEEETEVTTTEGPPPCYIPVGDPRCCADCEVCELPPEVTSKKPEVGGEE